MKYRFLFVSAILSASLPAGAGELERLREQNRQQEIKIRALELENRQLKGLPAADAEPTPLKKQVSTSKSQGLSESSETYLIRPGDTLAAVARKKNLTLKALLAANPGIKPNRMRPGQKIHLPSRKAETVSAVPAITPPAVEHHPKPPVTEISPASTQPADPTVATPPAPAPQPAAPARTGIVRILIENQTSAGDFAQRHGTTIERINQLNELDLTEGSILAKGSELLCPNTTP